MSAKKAEATAVNTAHRAEPISRDDIEQRFRAIQGGVDDVAGDAVNYALVIGIGVAVGVVAVAYWLGKRRGRRRGTVIELKRL
jgi:hypothetical protein